LENVNNNPQLKRETQMQARLSSTRIRNRNALSRLSTPGANEPASLQKTCSV
jgi:hypothetical protein